MSLYCFSRGESFLLVNPLGALILTGGGGDRFMELVSLLVDLEYVLELSIEQDVSCPQ